MKMMSRVIMALASFACLPLFALQCGWCNQPMLEGDSYCQNCGREKFSRPIPSPEHPKLTHEPVYRPLVTSAYTEPDSQVYRGRGQEDDSVGSRLIGMGRGIVTTALSPLNVVRGLLAGGSWAAESVGLKRRADGTYYSPNNDDVGAAVAVYVLFYVTCPIGTATGSVATCADAINGVVDLMSAGYYGDWLYDSDVKGHPTPWVWDREWRSTKIPWINR